MKKTSFLFLILLSSFNLFSQISKKDFFLSLNGNFSRITQDNGVLSNYDLNQVNSLNISPSGGYFLTDRLFVGIGLDYARNKEFRSNALYLDKYKQIEHMYFTSNAFLPRFIVGYYIPVIPKLYFNTHFSLGYGIINSKIYSALVQATETTNTLTPFDSYTIQNNEHQNYQTRYEYPETSLTPELTYFIKPGFALNLSLGGIEYTMFDWSINNSSWRINFSPEFWKLGVTFIL